MVPYVTGAPLDILKKQQRDGKGRQVLDNFKPKLWELFKENAAGETKGNRSMGWVDSFRS